MLDHSDLKTTLLFYTLVAALSDNYKNLTGYLINENFPKLYISERISCFDSLKWAASGYLTYQFIKKTGGADCVTKGIQGAFSYGKRMTWDRFFRKKRTL